MKKEDYKVLLIGFVFSAVYVGSMVLFPVAWACVNMVVFIVAVSVAFKRKKL